MFACSDEYNIQDLKSMTIGHERSMINGCCNLYLGKCCIKENMSTVHADDTLEYTFCMKCWRIHTLLHHKEEKCSVQMTFLYVHVISQNLMQLVTIEYYWSVKGTFPTTLPTIAAFMRFLFPEFDQSSKNYRLGFSIILLPTCCGANAWVN